MKMKPLLHALILLSSLFSFLPCRSDASTAQLKEGNRQFKNGHYEKSMKLYEDALIDRPYDSVLHFNKGAAAYQLGDFWKAERAFTEAAQSANPILKGGAHYNRGNALFRQGQIQGAIDAYKDALRANPQDEDAKYNLTAALNALKNPPKQQPKDQDQKQDDQKKNSKDQQGGQDDKKEGEQDKKPKPGEMTKEDAERLLAAAAANEKKKGNMQKGRGKEGPRTDEDW